MILYLNFMLHWIPLTSISHQDALCSDTYNQCLEIYLGTGRLILKKFMKFLFFFFSVHWALTIIPGTWHPHLILTGICTKYRFRKYLVEKLQYVDCGKRAFLEQRSHTGTNLDVLLFGASIRGCYWMLSLSIPHLFLFLQPRFNCKRSNSSVNILP